MAAVLAQRVRHQRQMQLVVAKTASACRSALPEVANPQFSPVPLTLKRPDLGIIPVWSVEVTAEDDTYLGHAIWSGDGAELLGISWNIEPTTTRVAGATTPDEQTQIARLRLEQMQIPSDALRQISATKTHNVTGRRWISFAAGGEKFCVYLDGSDRLLMVKRVPLEPLPVRLRESRDRTAHAGRPASS